MTDASQIVLAKRPAGDVAADCFREERVSLPPLDDGQLLIQQRFLSLDPYMRPRMTEMRSYTPPFALDQPLTGGSVGEVVESRHPRFAKGDLVMGLLNWATHTVHDGKGLRKIDAAGLSLSAYLGVLGMPSFTAWYGIRHICKPKPGEMVFVSAATGAVGQVAGQLAKLAGARVVGTAGDEDKCVWAVREAGYDACFNHRSERDYGAVLDKLCPQGIDADFENVGGKLFHAVFERMNNFGRVAFCGAISEYQDAQPMAGPPKMFSIVQKRLTLQGFIVSDHVGLMPEFINQVGGLLRSGKLKSRETVVDGLSKAPQAFIGLLKGENFGKQLVRIA
ncbi:MAG TPA: NADP-dependent oxidoreductase [Reyranella sp.]|nr:NADP-dependent oxidoreductase [Reyranella sp.]